MNQFHRRGTRPILWSKAENLTLIHRNDYRTWQRHIGTFGWCLRACVLKLSTPILDFFVSHVFCLREYKCSFCVKLFYHPEHLKRHLRTHTGKNKISYHIFFLFQKLPNWSPIPTECTLQERNRMNVKSATKPLVGMTAWWSTNEYIQVPYRYFRNFLRIVLSQSLRMEDPGRPKFLPMKS